MKHIALLLLFGSCLAHAADPIAIERDQRIVLLGNGLGSRMVHFGHFETGMHMRYPDSLLFIRNMCDEGNTPSFRAHSGRQNQLGFPGAEKFAGPYCDDNLAPAQGHLESEEDWLKMLKPDVLICFFGFTESFAGKSNLENFQAELTAFVQHTARQNYNGTPPPQIVLVSPTAFQDITHLRPVPDGSEANVRLAQYAAIIEAVAAQNDLLYVNAYNASLEWYAKAGNQALTSDGALLNDAGYQLLANLLIEKIFTPQDNRAAEEFRPRIQAAVQDKNWLWINDFKIPNGVHVFGRRYNPFGPQNYPFEIEKIREMTALRDEAIWHACSGRETDLARLDAQTSELPEVKTNINAQRANNIEFLKGDAALEKLTVPEGFALQQWATEEEFPNLANPVQLAFDNKGRLWVATMPSYPHWCPSDPRPDDKLIILEDTNNDGKADQEIVFADNLHLPMGFEITHEGVFIPQGTNLVLLKDEDGDDRADSREVICSGFDDHDTHHAIGAFTVDPSGAIIMCEGVFLRSAIDTPYGTIRGSDGGFFRFNPRTRHLERHAQLPIPNPWGVAYDEWGQLFFLHTSGTRVEWMLPGTVRPRYGVANPLSKDLIEPAHRVRPTSGLEFVSSRHFPPEMQGDMLLNNNIGFLGIKQHGMEESGTGYSSKWRQNLIQSADGNFRPVDLEFAPDGSLYLVDWHNPLIGHMQHNARDPHRDHSHGRIYRITCKGRPLVRPASIHGAPLTTLLDNLKLPEYRTRYRTRRELRGRNAADVLPALKKWVAALNPNQPDYEHHRLEALWVSWGANQIDAELLRELLDSEDHRVRAAAAQVLRYADDQIEDRFELLKKAIQDSHGRVVLTAIAAASWLPREQGLELLNIVDPQEEEETEEDVPVHIQNQGRTITLQGSDQPVRRIRLALPGNDERTLNINEIEVFVRGQNIANRARVDMSSLYSDQFSGSYLIDGNRNTTAHTKFEQRPWMRLTFPRPVAVEKVVIHNRPNFEDRINQAGLFFDGEMLHQINLNGVGSGDTWIAPALKTARAHLNNQKIEPEDEGVAEIPEHLAADAHERFLKGAEIYAREGFCGTCHQPDGNGLPAAGFPPLAATEWVNGNEERLIKVALNGLHGPITVKGQEYPGMVPMTGFRGLLNDEEMAAVLTYVRNAFGNQATPVDPEAVAEVREATKDKADFYDPAELLKQYPYE